MRFRVRFHKIRRPRLSRIPGRRQSVPRRTFARSMLGLAIGNALLASGIAFAADIPIDSDNKIIALAGTNNVYTSGGPWSTAIVSLGSSVAVTGNIDAYNIRDFLVVTLGNGASITDTGTGANAVILDQSYVDNILGYNIGLHSILLNNAGVTGSGASIHDGIAVEVSGNAADGDQQVALRNASQVSIAGAQVADMHGIYFSVNGNDPALTQSVQLGGGSGIDVANDVGNAFGIQRTGFGYSAAFSAALDDADVSANALAGHATAVSIGHVQDAALSMTGGTLTATGINADGIVAANVTNLAGTASAAITLDGGATLVAAGNYAVVGIGVRDSDSATVTLDAATVSATQNALYAGSWSALGLLASTITGTDTFTLRNGAALVVDGRDGAGIFAANAGGANVTLDNSSIQVGAEVDGWGITLGAMGDAVVDIGGTTGSDITVLSAGAATGVNVLGVNNATIVDTGSTVSATGTASALGMSLVGVGVGATVSIADAGVLAYSDQLARGIDMSATTSQVTLSAGAIVTADARSSSYYYDPYTATGYTSYYGTATGLRVSSSLGTTVSLADASVHALGYNAATGLELASGSTTDINLAGSSVTATSAYGNATGLVASGPSVSLDAATGTITASGATFADAVRITNAGAIDIAFAGTALNATSGSGEATGLRIADIASDFSVAGAGLIVDASSTGNDAFGIQVDAYDNWGSLHRTVMLSLTSGSMVDATSTAPGGEAIAATIDGAMLATIIASDSSFTATGNTARGIATRAGVGSTQVHMSGGAIQADGIDAAFGIGIDTIALADIALDSSAVVNAGATAADGATAAGVWVDGASVVTLSISGDSDVHGENNAAGAASRAAGIDVGNIGSSVTVTLAGGAGVSAAAAGGAGDGILVDTAGGTASITVDAASVDAVGGVGSANGIVVRDAATLAISLANEATMSVSGGGSVYEPLTHTNLHYGTATGIAAQSLAGGTTVSLDTASMQVNGFLATAAIQASSDGDTTLDLVDANTSATSQFDRASGLELTGDSALLAMTGGQLIVQGNGGASGVYLYAPTSGQVTLSGAAVSIGTETGDALGLAVDGSGDQQVDIAGTAVNVTTNRDGNATGIRFDGSTSATLAIDGAGTLAAHAGLGDATGVTIANVDGMTVALAGGAGLSVTGYGVATGIDALAGSALSVSLGGDTQINVRAIGSGSDAQGIVVADNAAVTLALHGSSVTDFSGTTTHLATLAARAADQVVAASVTGADSVAVDLAVAAVDAVADNGTATALALLESARAGVTAVHSSIDAQGEQASAVRMANNADAAIDFDDVVVTVSGGADGADGLYVSGSTVASVRLSAATVTATADAGATSAVNLSNMGNVVLDAHDATQLLVNVASGTATGVVANDVDDAMLSFSETSLAVTNAGGVAKGIDANRFGTLGVSLDHGATIAVHGTGGIAGVSAETGDSFTLAMADGAVITYNGTAPTQFYGVRTQAVGDVSVTLDNAAISAGHATQTGIAVSATGAGSVDVALTHGAALIGGADATLQSAGLVVGGVATIDIDASSGIEGGRATGTGSINGALVVTDGFAVVNNAGEIYGPGTALSVLAGAGAQFDNVAGGVLQGDIFAAKGDVDIDNSGLVIGALDVTSLVTHDGSELRAMLTPASARLSTGDAYWKVSGNANIANGTTIALRLAPALATAIKADPAGYDYLMLDAGTLVANTDALVLAVGPLIDAKFMDNLPAGELGVTFTMLSCDEAWLTRNGTQACRAGEDSTTGFVFDQSGDPDTWVPLVSDMVRDAPRAGARLVTAGVRQRLTAIDGGTRSKGGPIENGPIRKAPPRNGLIKGKGASSGDAAAGGAWWISGRSTQSRQDPGTGVAGFRGNGDAVTLGADTAIDDALRLGFAVTRASQAAAEKGDGNTLDSDATLTTLYSRWEAGDAALEMLVDWGSWNNKQVRYADSERITGSYDTGYTGVSVWVRQNAFAKGGWQVEPQLGVAYQKLVIDGYRESGNRLSTSKALVVQEQAYEVGELGGGVMVNRAVTLAGGSTWTPKAELMVWRDFIEDQTKVASRFITGSPTFVTDGVDPKVLRGTAGFGLEYATKGGLRIEGSADLTVQEGFVGQALSARLEYRY